MSRATPVRCSTRMRRATRALRGRFVRRGVCSATLAAICVLAACGIDQGGVRVEPTTTLRTTLVHGPITGFGSVLVNGLRLETSGVSVRVDGAPAAVADLRVGQMIRAVAAPDAGGFRALLIEQDENVIGPVAALDVATASFSVLGQIVTTDAGTRFDGSGLTALADLLVNDSVRVSGYTTPTGAILATYVGRATSTDPYQITGAITGVDTAALRFDLGELEVDYSQTAMLDVAGGVPQTDLVVEVTGSLVGGVLLADSVRELALVPGLFDSAATALTPAEQPIVTAAAADGDLAANFIGFITAANPPGRISLGDVDVLIRASTVLVGGTAGDLVVGTRVQIEGNISNLGQIEADRIRVF